MMISGKKIRKVLWILSCLLFVFSSAKLTIAFGTEPAVVYDGSIKKLQFVNLENTDLFPEFKDVIPGDVLTQDITFRCQNISNTTTAFLKAEIDDPTDLPDNITLTVYSDGEQISQGPVDETAGLNEYVKLGVFEKDKDVELKVVLTVPTSIGNEIQNVVKNVDWIFAVQETEGGSIIKPPQTGDNSQPMTYIILLWVSVVMIVALLIMGKNQKIKQNIQ